MLSLHNLPSIIYFLEALVLVFIFLKKFFAVFLGKIGYSSLNPSWLELEVLRYFYSLFYSHSIGFGKEVL